MNFLRISTFLLWTLVAGCATSAGKEAIYRGTYYYDFESPPALSLLAPDGKDEDWCVDPGSMRKARLPPPSFPAGFGTSKVAVRGKLGPAGHFGAQGRCTHMLLVSEIREVSAMQAYPAPLQRTAP